MNSHGFVNDHIDYGRELLHAGLQGLHAKNGNATLKPEIVTAARASLISAAVGAGLAWLGCDLLKRRDLKAPAVITCSAFAFCAEFGWRTRAISSGLVSSAAKEVSKVRDQHWLQANPIDYA